MAKHQDTRWPLELHTQAKHAILRRYLDAWLPIMTRWNGRVLYIDGFAGPGRYLGGEDGSPIVALKAALEHSSRITADLAYLFIEADRQRKVNLEQEVAELTLPPNIKVAIHEGRFDETVSEMLDELAREGREPAPSFAFVDPFGWSQTPFSLIKQLLANPRSEVLINFMYEEVNRFLSVPEHVDKWDRLFGTRAWREIVPIRGAAERRARIHALYERQLKDDAWARFVRSFEMRNKKDATDYFLFFATNNVKGLVKMKEAMWRVDPSGTFQFSDATVPGQLVLFELGPDFVALRRQIEGRFSGRTVAVEDVERFVVEETAFLPSHYKRRVLAEMEKEQPPALQIISSAPGRKRGTFPPGMRIRFR